MTIDNDSVNKDSTDNNTIKNDSVEKTTVLKRMVLMELLGDSRDVMYHSVYFVFTSYIPTGGSSVPSDTRPAVLFLPASPNHRRSPEPGDLRCDAAALSRRQPRFHADQA
jgi:hypothetical protein